MTDSRGWLLRLAAEFAVIVAGVLVALAADSWWQERVDRESELDYLLRLRDELVLDVEGYARRSESALLRADELGRLLDLLRGGEEVDEVWAMEALGWTLSLPTEFPRRVTFDQMLNEGRLARLDSDDLRSAVTGYYSRLENQSEVFDAWEALRRETELYFIAALPPSVYLFANASWRPFPSDPLPAGAALPEASEVRESMALLREDTRLQNLLIRGRLTLRRGASMMGNWSERAADLVTLVDRELAEMGVQP